MTPEHCCRASRSLTAQIRAIEKEKPKPIPVAMGITDGDYRFTPDGAGDEPAPGKGIKREEIEGSFSQRRSQAVLAPPSHFLLSRRSCTARVR